MRAALLTGVILSLTMIAIEVLHYRPLLAMPGGFNLVIETMVALILYGALIVWVTRSGRPSLLALVAAGLQIVHVTLENLIHLPAPWEAITSLTFMLGTFVIWGVAGYRSARSAGAIAASVVAGVSSAIVTMSILVAFGFVLEFYLVTPKPEYVATWGEFKRSGWTDIHAFTIANTLDSALSHLFLGPIVGAIFGGVAGVAAISGPSAPLPLSRGSR